MILWYLLFCGHLILCFRALSVGAMEGAMDDRSISPPFCQDYAARGIVVVVVVVAVGRLPCCGEGGSV